MKKFELKDLGVPYKQIIITKDERIKYEFAYFWVNLSCFRYFLDLIQTFLLFDETD